ncbi:MAG: sugar phosphate nucleotidyltransferase [Candidatus Sumerlaeia bacterium]|nr:sugar phosphate nucleotidyltransferase [Candidatus Sumerlaeia bacterium]
MKGVVLAGGLGTRLYPLTKITNKHLLPVYNRPMIHWPLLALVEAGVQDIMIVTGGSFAGAFLQLLGNGREFGLRDIHYTYQEGEGGIAEALSLAEHFVDGDRVVVILGDNIFEHSIRPYADAFAAQKSGARIVLSEVPDPQRFGVPAFDANKRITNIIEKPTQPPSNYAVAGIYMYDEYVWEVIRTLKPSDRGELEITDVNNAYLRRGDLEYSVMKGWWTDAGTFDSLLSASHKVHDREAKEPFAKFLRTEHRDG